MSLPEVSVCYLLRETPAGTEVLLGLKKTGLGKGNLVGAGGKFEPGETPEQATIREVFEEVGVVIRAAALTLIAEIDYPFTHHPQFSQKTWAYICWEWEGTPTESEELLPQWHLLADIPVDRMWDDAKQWLPTALGGEFVRATITFGEDGRTVVSTDFTAPTSPPAPPYSG